MTRLFAAVLLLAALPQVHAQQPHPRRTKERLRFTLILSRHGIRPPLTPAATLNGFSAEPWPTWEVPLGNLTPHGAEALKQMGASMRAELDATGLLAPGKCPAPTDFYLYADTDERNISSTRATMSGLAPGCGPYDVHTWVPNPDPQKRDPIFLPMVGTFTDATSPDAAATNPGAPSSPMASSSAKVGAYTPNPRLLADLAHILAPDSAHPAAHPVTAIPTPRGATTLVENLELEYMNDKPISDVGWGRVDEATLRHLLPLHIDTFAAAHRAEHTAQMENSNLLDHILDTLQQAAGTPISPAILATPVTAAQLDTSLNNSASDTAIALSGNNADNIKRRAGRPASLSRSSASALLDKTRINGAFGHPGARVVYISAHDTNLHGIAGLLHLHWKVDGIADEVPPDSQIIFELWQKPHKIPDAYPFTVRIRYRAQTLAQMRNATPLTDANPPAEVDLKSIGCGSSNGCNLPVFLHAARATIDPAYTQLDVPPTQIAP